MKTTLHTYRFDLNDPKDREPYHQLKTRLQKTPGRGHWMNAIASEKGNEPTPGEVTLETEFLFDNQWNTTTHRVFDWYEEYQLHNKLIKTGHYLDITEEMIAIRRETLKCGYTGQQFPASCGKVFNETEQAIASPYLKESDLFMLRLLPVSDTSQRKELTAEERAYLLPLYLAAQTARKEAAKPDQVAEINAEYAKEELNARNERDGKLWLLNRGVPLENVIYYTHTGKFGFGWRTPYGVETHAALLAALEDFPFAYEIKGEPTGHGRTTMGTSYFPTSGNAIRYYREQGEDAAAVDRKIAEGSIHIGRPPTKAGQTLSISDCRYHVTN